MKLWSSVRVIATSVLLWLLAARAMAQAPGPDVIVSFTATGATETTYSYRITPSRRYRGLALVRVPRQSTTLVAPVGWAVDSIYELGALVEASSPQAPVGPLAFQARSAFLPGLGELDLYPADDDAKWSAPRAVERIQVIAPTIYLAQGRPSAVAIDVLDQLFYRFVLELKWRSPRTKERFSALIKQIRRGPNGPAKTMIRTLIATLSDDLAPQPLADASARALRYDLTYVLSLLESKATQTPSHPATVDSWPFWWPPDVGTTSKAPGWSTRATVFLGHLEEATPVYIEDLQEMRTKFTFLVTEPLRGGDSLKAGTKVVVWARGGTAIENVGFRFPETIVRALQLLTSYFVWAEPFHGDGPLEGQLYIPDLDSLLQTPARSTYPPGSRPWLDGAMTAAKLDVEKRTPASVLDALRALAKASE